MGVGGSVCAVLCRVKIVCSSHIKGAPHQHNATHSEDADGDGVIDATEGCLIVALTATGKGTDLLTKYRPCCPVVCAWLLLIIVLGPMSCGMLDIPCTNTCIVNTTNVRSSCQVVVSDNEQVLRAANVRFAQYPCKASLTDIDKAVQAGVQLALDKHLAVVRKKVGELLVF